MKKLKRGECWGVCRDCKLRSIAQAVDFLKRTPPRCPDCGGMLEKVERRASKAKIKQLKKERRER